MNQHDVMAAISDQIKRARAISNIDNDSFTPQVIYVRRILTFIKTWLQSFKSSSRNQEMGQNESGTGTDNKFEFGTSIERKNKIEEDMDKLAREGLIHPQLFGDQAVREKRYLQHIWTIRQRAIQKMKG